VFGAGQYAPDTQPGKWLLAHELAHTIQQQAHPTAPQAKLAIGSAHDPAESAADRAADAALRGAPMPALSPAAPAIRRYQITSVDQINADERLVHLDNQTRYRIKRVRWLAPKTEKVGFVKPDIGIDRQRVWLELDWCAGQNNGQVRVGANIPEQLIKTIVQTATSGGDIDSVVRGLDITPFAEVTILQSGSFRLSAGGDVTINTKGDVTGGSARAKVSTGPFDFGGHVGTQPGGGVDVGVDVTVTPGRKTEQKDCRREKTTIVENTRYECQLERDVAPRDETRTRTVQDQSSRYIYFDYAQDTIHSRSAGEISALTGDLRDGYQVSNIRGFTSPEGPLAPHKGFMGNEELARKRAVAAAKLVRSVCPTKKGKAPGSADSCFVGGESAVTPTGEGELYTIAPLDASGTPQEVEGAPLAEHATDEFLKNPDEQRHRSPELEQQLSDSRSPQKHAEQVYPLLRRAVITLVRTRSETYTEHIPGSVQSEVTACPADVIERAFPASLDFSKGKP
jgi:hypothetical protein